MKNIHFSSSTKIGFAYRAGLFLGDSFCVAAALWLGFRLRFGWLLLFARSSKMTEGPAGSYLPFQLFIAVALLAVFVQSGFYRRLHVTASDEILRVFHGVAKGWLVVLAVTFLIRDISFSRLAFGFSALFCAVFLLVFRTLAKFLYRSVALRWLEPHRVLVIGDGRMSESVARVLSRHPGLLPERRPVAGPDALREFLGRNKVREVFASAPELDHVALMRLAEVCDEAGVSFKIIPDIMELRMGEIFFDDSLGLPSFTIRPASLRGSTFFYKRFFDIILSIVVLSFLFFPLLIVVLLIRLDSPGSPLYWQKRVGLKGRHFPFFKFRSMVSDADAQLADLIKLNDRSGPVFKMKNDPRVTKVGKWLRALSIDEFPQLLNVLRGEMSLVGPRPQVIWEAEKAGVLGKRRLNVLPGITGLWQVSGRAQLSHEQMIELDTYYIEHWSPGLDLTILFRTLPSILKGEGAY